MKVAVIFAGQIRHTDFYASKIYQHLLNLYDVDVYAHLWYDESLIGQRIHHEHYDVFEAKDYVGEFVRTYKPKAYMVEPPRRWDMSSYAARSCEPEIHMTPAAAHAAIERMISMWYSVNKAYSLIPNPDEYDFIVRLRTDSSLTKPIDLYALQRDKVYVETGRAAGADRRYSDWFAVGAPALMKRYADSYHHMHKYQCNGMIHMHRLVDHLLNGEGIPNTDHEFGVPICHKAYKYPLDRPPPWMAPEPTPGPS
jgi:hypothetical protein